MEKITLEQVQKLHQVLMGEEPADGVQFGKGHQPKLSAQKAFSTIWYLQEVLRVIPDNFEMCISCKQIYNTLNEGHHCEKCEKFYCDSCTSDCKHYYTKEQ